ncbi:MAG: RNA polymerase sigma-70 factor ECF subfamily [Stygiobacter sp.]|nr:MAG: RNA polymerase sigma-70 factor ECF subfamily [Stygiobacter sp.]KAF0211184.1 MAG: RNA polymerase sigma-70 factor ECF [Ignavibacteria bacterium]
MLERETQKEVESNLNEKLIELYSRIKSKDESALQEFFFSIQPQLFYYLFRYTNSREIAEDLTQESFVKFWLAIDNLDPRQSFKAYLFKIARNLAINQVQRSMPLVSFDEENILLQLSKSIDSEIDNSFFMNDFQQAINTLPERCKSTFLLSRFSGFSYSEISEVMGVSLQTVKNQMNKALAVLRKRLIKYID